MSIIRAVRPQSNFYILDKRISEDKGLSWGARGLLVFLLGKPDHWKVSVEHLRKETQTSSKPSGRDAIYGMLDELIKNGYVKRELAKADNGTLAGYDYYVFDEPVTLGDAEDAPCTGLPDTAEPHTAEPYTANPTLVSTDKKQVLKEVRIDAGLTASALEADGLDADLASELLAHRKRKKAALTQRAWDAIKREAGKAGWPLQAAVEKLIERDWKGFEADWVAPKRGGGNGKRAEWDAVMAQFVGQRGNPDDPYTIDMEV